MVVLGINPKTDGTFRFALIERNGQQLDVRDVGSAPWKEDGKDLRELLERYGTKHVAIAIDEPSARISIVDVPSSLPEPQIPRYVRTRALSLNFGAQDDARSLKVADAWFCAAADAAAINRIRAIVHAAGGRVDRIEHAPTASIRAYPTNAHVIAEPDGDNLRVTLISSFGYGQIRIIPYDRPLGIQESKATTLGRSLDTLITEAETSGFLNPGLTIFMPASLEIETRRRTRKLSVATHDDWEAYAAAIGTALGDAANNRGLAPSIYVDFNKTPAWDPLRAFEPFFARVPIEQMRVPIVVSAVLLAITALQIIDTLRAKADAAHITEALNQPVVANCIAAVNADAARYDAKVAVLTAFDAARYSTGTVAAEIARFLTAVPADVRFNDITIGAQTSIDALAQSQRSGVAAYADFNDPSTDYDAKPIGNIVSFTIKNSVAKAGLTPSAPTVIPIVAEHCLPATREALLQRRLP